MSDTQEKTDRGYDLLLAKLETWIDELATRGPRAMPDVYRELSVFLDSRPAYKEPCIDFNHQKNYN